RRELMISFSNRHRPEIRDEHANVVFVARFPCKCETLFIMYTCLSVVAPQASQLTECRSEPANTVIIAQLSVQHQRLLEQPFRPLMIPLFEYGITELTYYVRDQTTVPHL